MRLVRRAGVALIAGLLAMALLGFGWRSYRSAAGAPTDRLGDAWHEGQRVLDREGRLLRELPSEAGHRGRSVPLARMGDRIVLTTLVSEDKGFYEHDGVDKKAALRALTQNA